VREREIERERESLAGLPILVESLQVESLHTAYIKREEARCNKRGEVQQERRGATRAASC
jgi:hypothetical protein